MHINLGLGSDAGEQRVIMRRSEREAALIINYEFDIEGIRSVREGRAK